MAPVADGSPRDSCLTGDGAVVEPRADELLDRLEFGVRSHNSWDGRPRVRRFRPGKSYDSPMSDAGAYVAIGALAVLLLIVANRSTGMNPLLAGVAQILVVVAAIALIEPLGAKPVIALVIVYYAGFFMGRAFEQEKAKPRREAPPRRPRPK